MLLRETGSSIGKEDLSLLPLRSETFVQAVLFPGTDGTYEEGISSATFGTRSRSTGGNGNR